MKMLTAFVTIAFTLFGCTGRDTVADKKNLNGYDYRIFQGTRAWEVAKAVQDQDTAQIIGLITKDKTLLECKDAKFGGTLLAIAVKTLKYNAVKTLVSLGADPNSQDSYAGSSPFMYAADILLTDAGDYGSNPKYLQLLLQHGGDPNAEQKGERPPGYNVRLTPLLNACSTGYVDYVKILVNAGANVNHHSNKVTPLFKASFSAHPIYVVKYLIEKGADYKQPLMQRINGTNIYITDIMRDWRFDLNSKEYKEKMQIASFLKQNGLDYWKAKIPERYLDEYPKAYLEKY